MKLIVAIINKDDTGHLSKDLIKNGFFITTLNTTGGFLRSENHTALIGVDDEKVSEVLEIIERALSREQWQIFIRWQVISLYRWK